MEDNAFAQGKKFDIQAYMGLWYEVGKYAVPYETDCDLATAHYEFNPKDHVVNVLNICYNHGTPISSIEGVAKTTQIDGIFKIMFKGIERKSFYMVVWTDYTRFALVSGMNDSDVFWVLSRHPTISQDEINQLTALTIRYGFNPNRVEINTAFKYQAI